ncbi:MAG: endonuclease MutS2 [Eubacteriaceae bacterium]
MDRRSMRALEYDKIKDKLAQYCVNDGARETALALQPQTDLSEIKRELDFTDEALGMSLRSGRLPVSKNEDISGLLGRAAVGSTLQIFELRRIAAVLRTIRDLINYRDDDSIEEPMPLLDDAFDVLDACSDLEQEISHKLISDTEVADNASRELARIRREILNKGRRITEKLQGIITSPGHERHLQDRLVTIRGGRYVVPVKTEYRSQIPGIVLDRSSSGNTLFIEPASVVELNNDLRLLEAEEKDEIERILKGLSETAALYRTVIQSDYDTMIELDYVFAKAAYALDLNARSVELSERGETALIGARHPLIARDKVVPSNIVLDDDISIMVITGPNTGGKTVTLKTMGLLTLMIQSGLFIPVKEHSKARVFTNVFADIGDEQSIEQNLSTFSSHMTNIVDILNHADDRSLVLFDELGAGTDPEEGASLAVSILDSLKDRGGLTAATTHYAELKEYGLTTDGVVNASVEFDVETLRPTYRLMIGIPGKSNAFEIASRLGLPEDIIKVSRERISENTRDLDKSLAAAEEKTREATLALERAEAMEAEAQEKLKQAEAERGKNAGKAEKLLLDAQQRAADLIDQTKKETDSIYREIQTIQRQAEASVDNKTLEKLRRSLAQSQQAAEKAEESRKKRTNTWDRSRKPLKLSDFKTGDRVYVKSIDREAEVLEILERDKKVRIQSGNMKLNVKPAELVKVGKQEREVPVKKNNVKATPAKVAVKLDLRGRTADEAVMMTEKFISDAVYAGQTKLTIVHGMGTGRVRAAVQNYLKTCPMIKNYRLGKPDEGGTGATIVTL